MVVAHVSFLQTDDGCSGKALAATAGMLVVAVEEDTEAPVADIVAVCTAAVEDTGPAVRHTAAEFAAAAAAAGIAVEACAVAVAVGILVYCPGTATVVAFAGKIVTAGNLEGLVVGTDAVAHNSRACNSCARRERCSNVA